MGKFYGPIGYAATVETKPGVWEETIVERSYYGDLLRVKRDRPAGDSATLNDNLNISNELSIIADPFAYQNSAEMRYVYFMGSRWKITSIEVRYPRLILQIGGVYNGPTPRTSEETGGDSGE